MPPAQIGLEISEWPLDVGLIAVLRATHLISYMG